MCWICGRPDPTLSTKFEAADVSAVDPSLSPGSSVEFEGPSGGNDTIAGSTSTTSTLSAGSTVYGVTDTAGDQDWFRITVSAGQSIRFNMNAAAYNGAAASGDTYLRLMDSSGNVIAENDDFSGTNSQITYTFSTGGTYYVSAQAYASYTGGYALSATSVAALPVYTNTQIADQLVTGYWTSTGSGVRAWAAGNTDITFNVQGLTAERAAVARLAFATWADICGRTFTETSGTAEITLDDNDSSGAYASSTRSGSTILSSTINVSPTWSSGTSATYSYTFQTFIHEIGHTLGLGHGGNYNGSATYGVDNHYQNDTWQYSIMSYMTQSNYGGASTRYVMTPQMADIEAAIRLYGAGSARSTDTVYGFNVQGLTGATAALYNFSTYTGGAPSLTIYDSGGTDTLDVSGYSNNQTINLNGGTWSSIGGYINNIGIYTTSNIENAIGGSGGETITGNSLNNRLDGGGGADIIRGGGGHDTLIGGSGADQLYGDEGDDAIYYDSADTVIQGGNGTDTLIFTSGSAPVSFNLQGNGFERAEGRLTDTGGNSWASRIDVYDERWWLASSELINDNGTRTYGTFDNRAAYSWAEIWTDTDTLLRTDRQTIRNDNGTYEYGDYDQASANSWAEIWTVTDTLGRTDRQVIRNDNGTYEYGEYDQASANSWTEIWTVADTLGRTDRQTIRNDNNTYEYGDYDQASANSWTEIWTVTDTLGRTDRQTIRHDNGTYSYGDFDQASANTWTEIWTVTDTLGRSDYQNILHDNGNRQWIDFDQAGAYGWAEHHTVYNASGALISEWWV